MRHLSKSICIFFTAIIFLSSCTKEDPKPSKPPVAIADNSENIQLPKDSISLTGKGTSADGTIVGYIWSQVSGPGVATIVSPSAATTTVRSLKAGTYIFQFAVIDNFGLTGVDTLSVTVAAPPILTLSLQPANNYDEVHIWGNNSGLDHSNNISPEIGAISWTYFGTPFGMRATFKFDLSSIPTNASIISAQLTLYSNPTPLNGDHVNANAGSDNTMLIQRVTNPWDPSKVNWTHQPETTTTDQIIIPSTTKPFLDLTDVDVTKLVNTMVNNNANYGFLIKLKNEVIYTSRVFCSSKYQDATKHPKLLVTYKFN